ncbi:MAG TPA: hypothetical protein VK087_02745 [Tissierellaceae bacterium]|nr:hypothetical protein [Tissierellaceae bacterium]
MASHSGFINISTIQCFDNKEVNIDHEDKDEDININETSNNVKNENLDIYETCNDTQDTDIDFVHSCDDHQDDIDPVVTTDNQDTFIDTLTDVKVKSKTLDILPNTCEIPIGNSDGVIIKTSVVLAQLVIPINLSTSIKLPEKAFEITDIKQNLQLEESTLIQSTDILFIKGFVHKNIEYSTKNPLNDSKIYRQIQHHTIDIPFEYSTSINFFTQPLDHIMDINEIFQYDVTDSSQFNLINKSFFNESPICKLLSSRIIEHNEYKDCQNKFTKIENDMNIELKIEILQNQPIVIPSSANNNTKL